MTFVFYIIITLMWCWVLPMFYPAPTNTTLTLLYTISYVELKKSQRNHSRKTAGLPQIRAPPPK